MRTVGRYRPRNSPRGDIQATCSYCGTRYYRSQLRIDRAGFLACPEETGRDVVTLAELNARSSLRRPPVPPMRGGNYTYPIPLGHGISTVPTPDQFLGTKLSIWWRPDQSLVTTDPFGRVVKVLDKMGANNIGDPVSLGLTSDHRPAYGLTTGPKNTPAIVYTAASGTFSPVHLTAVPFDSPLCWLIVCKLPMGVNLSKKVAAWRIGSGGDFTAQFLTDAFSVGGPYQSASVPYSTDTTAFHSFVFAPSARSASNPADSAAISDGGIGGGNAGGANADLVLCDWCWLNDIPTDEQITSWDAYVRDRYGL